MRWWRNWLPSELYRIKLMIYLSAKTCGHQNIFQIPSRSWWNSVRHCSALGRTDNDFSRCDPAWECLRSQHITPTACHHTLLSLSINPWCQTLMSEQSFCDRKLFIVSLLASLNPHYYHSVWLFVLLHCCSTELYSSTRTLIFSWNDIYLIEIVKPKYLHKLQDTKIPQTDDMFSNIVVFYPWLADDFRFMNLPFDVSLINMSK